MNELTTDLKSLHVATLNNLKNSKAVNTLSVTLESVLKKEKLSFTSQEKLLYAKKALEKNNISFGNYYPYGLHQFPISLHDGSILEETEWATKNIITLPIHKGLKKEDIKFIAQVLNTIP